MSKSKKDELAERTQAVRDAEAEGFHFWWTIGENVWHVHQKALWKEGFHSFQKWLEETVPISRRSAYDAMKAWGELHDLEGYVDIPRENAKLLANDVPKSKRKRYLKNAKIMPARKFKAFIEGGKVGAAKAQNTVGKQFIFEIDQWAKIEQALDFMLAYEDVTTPEAGIEYMAAEFLQDPVRADKVLEMEQDANAATESEESES